MLLLLSMMTRAGEESARRFCCSVYRPTQQHYKLLSNQAVNHHTGMRVQSTSQPLCAEQSSTTLNEFCKHTLKLLLNMSERTLIVLYFLNEFSWHCHALICSKLFYYIFINLFRLFLLIVVVCCCFFSH